jgi:hypothetical protein
MPSSMSSLVMACTHKTLFERANRGFCKVEHGLLLLRRLPIRSRHPPSTAIIAPVMKLASLLARIGLRHDCQRSEPTRDSAPKVQKSPPDQCRSER